MTARTLILKGARERQSYLNKIKALRIIALIEKRAT
jgi:hypothetical protein